MGDIGATARTFIDWLEQAGLGAWQVLPLNPTGISTGDRITSDRTPTLRVALPANAQAGDQLRLYNSATLIFSISLKDAQITAGSADIGIPDTMPLADGSYTYQARVMSGATLVQSSGDFNLTVLTAAPAPGIPGSGQCVLNQIAIDSGPNSGANTQLEFTQGPGQPNLLAGEHIRIIRQVDSQGTTSYGFYDYERTWPLILLAAAFAVVIVAVARWRGLDRKSVV